MSSGYVQQGQKWGQQIQSELSQLSSYSPVQLEQYVDQYQQQYCTPASITPEMKMPGNYTGKQASSVSLSSLSSAAWKLLPASDQCLCVQSSRDKLSELCAMNPLLAAGTSIVLSFQLGNCTFDSDWTSTKEIECEQPSLVYIKSPAVLTAPYKTPVSFTDEVFTQPLPLHICCSFPQAQPCQAFAQ